MTSQKSTKSRISQKSQKSEVMSVRSSKSLANPTVVKRRSDKNQSAVGNPAYVKAKWIFIGYNNQLKVAQDSMRLQ